MKTIKDVAYCLAGVLALGLIAVSPILSFVYGDDSYLVLAIPAFIILPMLS